MNKVTYKVLDISCGHCERTIESEIGELEGVLDVSASAETKLVEIQYQDPASKTLLQEKLQEINYPVSSNPIS